MSVLLRIFMDKLPSNRWVLVKQLISFQVKLAFDAIRDLFLSPISFICALIDISKNKNIEQSYFNKLMNFGSKTDVWINLFSDHNDNHRVIKQDDTINNVSVKDVGFVDKGADQLFNKIEDLIREHHAKGGLTASAKNKIDLYLNKLGSITDENNSSSKNLAQKSSDE